MESQPTSARNVSALILGAQGIFPATESKLDALTERLLRQFDGIFEDDFLGLAIAGEASASRPVPGSVALGGAAIDYRRELPFLEFSDVFPARRGSCLLCCFERAGGDAPVCHDLPLTLDIRSQGLESGAAET